MPLVTLFLQCWYFQGCISGTTCWLVLLQLQLQVHTQQGRSNQRVFGDYLKHFFACERPYKEDLVLLILDNHESHLSIPAINVAKENRILLLTLPPHTSCKLEPLDCAVFGPYKTYYNACLKWLDAVKPRQTRSHVQCYRHYWKDIQQGIYHT
jgi:hypothetical protein